MRLAALVLVLLAQDVSFEEKFAGKLSDGWSWVREDSAGWKLDGGALKIKAQPGTIWYKKNDAKNIITAIITIAVRWSSAHAITFL